MASLELILRDKRRSAAQNPYGSSYGAQGGMEGGQTQRSYQTSRPILTKSTKAKKPETDSSLIDFGQTVTGIQLPDGTIAPAQAPSGAPYLIKKPGSRSTFLDPDNGNTIAPDLSNPTGLVDITAQQEEEKAARATERSRVEQAKLYEKVQKDLAQEKEDERKHQNAIKTNEYLAQGRKYFLDRETGEPVPLLSDQEFEKAKTEKAQKAAEASRAKAIGNKLKELEIEADTLKLDEKPLTSSEYEKMKEEVDSLTLAITGEGGTTDEEGLAKFATDDITRQITDQYRQNRERLKREDELRAKLEEIERKKLDLKRQALHPEKWKAEKEAVIKGASDADLDREAKESQQLIQELESKATEEYAPIQARDKELSDAHNRALERLQNASTGAERILAQRQVDEAMARLRAWDEESADARASVRDTYNALNDRIDLVNQASQERKNRIAKERDDAMNEMRSSPFLKPYADRMDALDQDESTRLADLAEMYPDGIPAEAQKALQDDITTKRQQLAQEIGWAQQTKEANLRGLYQKYGAGNRSEDWRTENDPAYGGLLIGLKEDARKAGITEQELRESMERSAALDWSTPRRVDEKGRPDFSEDYRMLPDGAVTVNPRHYLDAEEYAKAVESSPATPEQKKAALAMRRDLAAPLAAMALSELMEDPQMGLWIQGNTKGTPLEKMEQFNEKLKKGGAIASSYNAFRSGAGSLAASLLGGIAAATGSENATEYGQYYNQHAQAYQMAAEAAGKGTGPLGKFVSKVSGAVPSLVPGIAIGMATGGAGLGVTGALVANALTAGLQSLGGTYLDAYEAYQNKGLSPTEARAKALTPAIASGLVTSLVTAAGGARGAESVLASVGREGLKSGIKASLGRVVTNLSEEALEEFSDQLLQGVIQQASYAPEKDIKDILNEAIEAGLVGAALGGGISGVQEIAQRPSPVTDLTIPTEADLPEQTAAVGAAIKSFAPTSELLPQAVMERAGQVGEAKAAQDAASGLVAIAKGAELDALPAAQLEALGYQKGAKGVEPRKGAEPLVYIQDGQAVIRDEAIQWLEAEEQPIIRDQIGLTEQERINQIKAPKQPEVKEEAKPAAQDGITATSGQTVAQEPQTQPEAATTQAEAIPEAPAKAATPDLRRAIGKGKGGQPSYAEFGTPEDVQAFTYASLLRRSSQGKNKGGEAERRNLSVQAQQNLQALGKALDVPAQELRGILPAYNDMVRKMGKETPEGQPFKPESIREFVDRTRPLLKQTPKTASQDAAESLGVTDKGELLTEGFLAKSGLKGDEAKKAQAAGKALVDAVNKAQRIKNVKIVISNNADEHAAQMNPDGTIQINPRKLVLAVARRSVDEKRAPKEIVVHELIHRIAGARLSFMDYAELWRNLTPEAQEASLRAYYGLKKGDPIPKTSDSVAGGEFFAQVVEARLKGELASELWKTPDGASLLTKMVREFVQALRDLANIVKDPDWKTIIDKQASQVEADLRRALREAGIEEDFLGGGKLAAPKAAERPKRVAKPQKQAIVKYPLYDPKNTQSLGDEALRLENASRDISGQDAGAAARPSRFYDEAETRRAMAAQKESLKGKAQAGRLTEGFAKLSEGGEHFAFIHPSKDLVFKETKPNFYGYVPDEDIGPNRFNGDPLRRVLMRLATPAEYLHRLAVFSHVTGVPVRLEAIEQGDAEYPRIVTSMPFFKGINPSMKAVTAYMEGLGFKPLDWNQVLDNGDTIPMDEKTWYREKDGILVTDAVPSNFKQDPDTGVIVPLDLMMMYYPLSKSEPLAAPQGSPPITHVFPDGYVLSAPGLQEIPAKPIRAYHSTPHKVDKFTTAKIGTGEGNLAYGRGLYFAENSAVSGRGGFYDQQFTAATGAPANIYTVEILPEPEAFLNWDKRLNDQSPAVKSALEGIFRQHLASKNMLRLLSDIMDKRWLDAYTFFPAETAQETSQKLLAAGIPGIRYLDGLSRGEKEGTYNYVIFDESLVRILEENGKPVEQQEALASPSAPEDFDPDILDTWELPKGMMDRAREYEKAMNEAYQLEESELSADEVELDTVKDLPIKLREIGRQFAELKKRAERLWDAKADKYYVQDTQEELYRSYHEINNRNRVKEGKEPIPWDVYWNHVQQKLREEAEEDAKQSLAAPSPETPSPVPPDGNQGNVASSESVQSYQEQALKDLAALEDLRTDSEAMKALAESIQNAKPGTVPADPANRALMGTSKETRAIQQAALVAQTLNGRTVSKHADVFARAKEAIAKDRAAVQKELFDKIENDVGFREDDLAQAQILSELMQRESMLNPDDKELYKQLLTLTNYWADNKTETGRALSIMRDPAATPLQRMRLSIAVVGGPPARVRRLIKAAWTPKQKAKEIVRLEKLLEEAKTAKEAAIHQADLDVAKARQDRDEIMAQYAEENRKQQEEILKKMGLTQDDVLLDPEDRYGIIDEVLDVPSIRDSLATMPKSHQQAVRLAMMGYSDEAISTRVGMKKENVPAVVENFRQNILKPAITADVKKGKSFSAFVREGLKRITGRLRAPFEGTLPQAEAASKMTAQDSQKIQDEVNRIINFALQPAKWRNKAGAMKAKVVKLPNGQKVRMYLPFDPDDARGFYEYARELSTREASAFDKIYEYWINGILSGPQTQVANIAGNAAQIAWHYTAQRTAEAFLNIAYRDSNSARLGEFPHVFKAFWKALSPALEQAKLSWATEGDLTRTEYLNEPLTLDFKDTEIDKVGGYRPAIKGKKGRIIRIPGRILRFVDAYFKTAVLHAEVTALAYREAKAMGYKGKALDAFMTARMSEKGSDIWQQAMDTAEELLFQSDNWMTRTASGFVRQTGRVESIQQQLAKAESEGNIKEAEKLRLNLAASRFIAGMMRFIFPFTKTPTNILRVGARKSGGAALAMLWNTANGLWQVRNGKPFASTYAKASQIKDLSETALAGLAWATLAGLSEGDEDDDKKTILFVGNRPYGSTSQGEREEVIRKYGGTQVIVFRDPVTGKELGRFAYGRYEPFATAFGVMVDTLREFKQARNEPAGAEKASKLAGAVGAHLIAQAESKSFLQGFHNISRTMEDIGRGSFNPGASAGKFIVSAVVPNLIRQPMRNMDDYQRDFKSAGWQHEGLPTGKYAETATGPGGKPIEKGGSSVSRLFFQFPNKPSQDTAERVFQQYNLRHPETRIDRAPLTESMYFAYGPDGKTKMVLSDRTDKRIFRELYEATYARLAQDFVARQPTIKMQNPPLEVVQKAENLKSEAVSQARKRFFAQKMVREASERAKTTK